MHEFMLWVFTKLKDSEKFLRLIVIFFIMILALYWFQNLLGAHWFWLSFLTPPVEWLLNICDKMYSYSFDFWGKAIEIKYFVALIVLLIITFCLNIISFIVDIIQNLYEDAHLLFKKSYERVFNRNLKADADTKAKNVSGFMLYIQTKSSNKYANNNVILEEQNQILNKFITDKLNVEPVSKWDGYVYTFNHFDKIDKVLELLFKIKNADVPLDYLICIQAGNNEKQLKKLAELQLWDKISIAADTLYCYNLKVSHLYETTSVGVFQYENNTLEVHEIVEEL